MGNVPKLGARDGDKSFGLGTRVLGMGTKGPQTGDKGWGQEP